MNTPIYDFVNAYRDLRPARFHMPGHKGRGPLGCEAADLTEISGADSLYEARGIIAQSEANASALFGCPTFYSTEGSSHCIRAMLYLAALLRPEKQDGAASPVLRVLAARNVHTSFLSAAALLDPDLVWLPAAGGSYLSASVTPEVLDAALAESGADAVWLSCPDYLGFLPDLRPLAEVCHAHGALLLTDNAHGAYLRFLSPSRHPMDLGADLCCDSAHKTLPVLTGGAYLHVSQALLRDRGQAVRDALALFGSTSPSYLILQSLDLANPYLEALPEKLAAFLPRVEALKERLRAAGRRLIGDEPLKLTLDLRPAAAAPEGTGPACPLPGVDLAAALEREGIFCEFADPEQLVFMLSPENTEEELERLERALTETALCAPFPRADGRSPTPSERAEDRLPPRSCPERVCSIREAMLAPAERIPAAESLGRVLARPGVSCPPAVPIRMPGERIDAEAVRAFARYGIESVSVLF